MSLYLGKIGSKILSRSLTSPKLGKATNTVGKVLSVLSMGHYKVGLTRTAFQLSQLIKPGDTLKIQSGQIIKEDAPILTNEKLFKGVNIDHIEVTEKMLSPEGMASYLRWDAIGNVPSLMASIFPLLGSILWAKLIVIDGCNLEFPGYSTIMFLTASPFFIPYHRMFALFTPKKGNDTIIRLSDAENYTAEEFHFSQRSICGGCSIPLIPQLIFINNFKFVPPFGISRALTITHEKTHFLGASEYRAYKIQDEKMMKLIFHNNKTRRAALEWFYLLRNFLSTIFIGCFKSNIETLIYLIIFGRIYHRPNPDIAFLQLINNKQELEKLIERFEKGEKKLDDEFAAAAYIVYGKPEKALLYYQKFLNEIKDGEKRGIRKFRGDSIYTTLQIAYLAVGITMQEIGNVQEAKNAFQNILEVNRGSGTNSLLSSIAQAKLDEIDKNSQEGLSNE